MAVFSSVLTGSLQSIAERPLPCNYNVIQFVLRPFTAQTRVQIPPGTPIQQLTRGTVYSPFNKRIGNRGFREA
jgi:hypothetical protein